MQLITVLMRLCCTEVAPIQHRFQVGGLPAACRHQDFCLYSHAVSYTTPQVGLCLYSIAEAANLLWRVKNPPVPFYNSPTKIPRKGP